LSAAGEACKASGGARPPQRGFEASSQIERRGENPDKRITGARRINRLDRERRQIEPAAIGEKRTGSRGAARHH
jgi:hypothetical protein